MCWARSSPRSPSSAPRRHGASGSRTGVENGESPGPPASSGARGGSDSPSWSSAPGPSAPSSRWWSSLDRGAFTAINSLGAGPDWVYLTLDPHSRNYVLLCLIAVAVAWLAGPRHALAVMVAVTVAAVFSDILVQTAYVLYDRPRPEEVPAAQALLTNGREWSHIASFPSGHMVVTTAIAVAAMSTVPALRAPMWIYVALIAITRVTFGAHFPLDVIVGLVFGFAVGRFSAAFVQSAGLLRRPLASTSAAPA